MCAPKTAGRNSKQSECANIPVWANHGEQESGENRKVRWTFGTKILRETGFQLKLQIKSPNVNRPLTVLDLKTFRYPGNNPAR